MYYLQVNFKEKGKRKRWKKYWIEFLEKNSSWTGEIAKQADGAVLTRLDERCF